MYLKTFEGPYGRRDDADYTPLHQNSVQWHNSVNEIVLARPLWLKKVGHLLYVACPYVTFGYTKLISVVYDTCDLICSLNYM